MTIELDDFETPGDVSGYLDWALKTGVWDGREVSWLEASEFQDEMQSRILEMLFENSDNPAFEQLAAQLAWIGTPASEQSLLARDIQELDFSKSDLILQTGMKKSLSKFWKKHKKEILIGAALVAVVTVVVVVAVSTAGTGAGAAAAAGGAALGGIPRKGDSEKEKRAKNPPQTQNAVASPALPPLQAPDLSKTAGQLTFGAGGIAFNGQYSSYNDILMNKAEPALLPSPPANISPVPTYAPPPFPQMHPDIAAPWYPAYLPDSLESNISTAIPQDLTPQKKAWSENFLDAMVRGIQDNPDRIDFDHPVPPRPHSTVFSTLGTRDSDLAIFGGNGMNTTMDEAVAHANHLAQFTEGRAVDWVYNQSHGPVIDLAEIMIFNLPGYSPHTAEQHLELWTKFHEANQHRPDAKCLQIGHSQDTIHIRNALERASPEIRNRVIAHLFGPAAMLPKGLCFYVQHYVCDGDVIPYAEIPYTYLTEGLSKSIEVAVNRQELIVVPRHPDTKSPHDFQNPAFDPIKRVLIRDYINQNGEYK